MWKKPKTISRNCRTFKFHQRKNRHLKKAALSHLAHVIMCRTKRGEREGGPRTASCANASLQRVKESMWQQQTSAPGRSVRPERRETSSRQRVGKTTRQKNKESKLNGTDNIQLSSPSRRYNHEGKTVKVWTVSSRSLREHGGNGAAPALESPREKEKCLRGSIVRKLDPNQRDIEKTCYIPTTLRKMPRLSEPGPPGMRAVHWYDFGSFAGNSNLFVHVVAHIAAAAVPHSVLQYLKAGKITPLAKPTGGHRPLLIMSFLRRLALTSVMAAKKESVAKCARLLKKTKQYLGSLLPLASRLPSRLCLGDPCCTVSRKPMRILLLSSPSGTPAPQSTECIETQPTTKSVPTVVWIRVVLCQRVDCQQLLTQYSVQSWRSFAHITTHDWYLWIKPQYLLQTIAAITAATRSVNLALQTTRHKCGKALARTPFHLSFKTRSQSHSAVWEDIYKSIETLSPALSFWESRPPWRRQHNAFRELPPHLQTSTLRDSMCRQ